MVISHWCQLIEGLQASPLEFYKCLEEVLDRRKIPGLARAHILWPEGGLLSAKREYLRLTREKLLFDVCAAPFGTGFFISYRLVDREFPWLLLVAVVLAASFTIFILWLLIILVAKGLLAAIATVGVLAPVFLVFMLGVWFAWRFGRGVLLQLDEYLLAMPVLGQSYERITRRNTYYRIDLICMFQAAVHAAVLEIVDKHIDVQHLKPLSEFERKPVMSRLFMR